MTAFVGSRILMLLENNAFPQDARVRREAYTLTEAGHHVSVIAPRDPGQPWSEIVKGVKVYRYPAPPEAQGLIGYLWEYGFSLLAAFLLSIRVFFKGGFDVIHAHNPPDLFVLIALFYKPLGKRFVFDHHDLSPEMYYARFEGKGSRFLFNALEFFEKLSCKVADRVISTNQSYKDVAISRSGVPEDRITIVRNGPDLSRVFLVDPDPELRQKASTILGYVGSMGFQDGIDYLLRSLHALVHELGRTDFYAVLVGNGDAFETMKELKEQLKLNDYIWFTDSISDADFVRYLSTADICLDPDPSNSFNDRCTMIKMTEYMAFEKPIVAFDLPEHRVTAKDAAIYAMPNVELDFAKKIALLMDDADLRTTMGRIGRQRIETELAWSHQKQSLLDAYEALGFPSNEVNSPRNSTEISRDNDPVYSPPK